MQKENQALFKYLYQNIPTAYAVIKGGNEYPNISGLAQFYSFYTGVLIIVDVDNLPNTPTNFFALHIHEGSSCGDNFEKTGSHYNPKSLPHPCHAGDLPPLLSNNGSAWLAVFTERVKIEEIINKTIVIHDSFDDFTTQPAGNSGQKIACGEIKRHTNS